VIKTNFLIFGCFNNTDVGRRGSIPTLKYFFKFRLAHNET